MKNIQTKNRKRSFTILPLVAVLLIVLLFSCSKDLGNYDYNDANKVDITSSADSFAVRQDDTLSINVSLSQTTSSNNLSYRWYLIQYSSTNANPPQFELDSTRNLKWKVTVVPGLYKIVNKVTDQSTGVSFYKYFKLNVLPAPWGGEGWLVLQDQSASQNGNDLSIILSRDGVKRGDVYHNLYFQANGRKLPLGTKYMSVINYTHSLARQKVMFAYDGGGVEVKAIDFSDSSYAPNWFLNAPADFNIGYDASVDGGAREIIINNGELYYRNVNPAALAAPPILFGAPILGTWELSPFVMQYSNLADLYVTLYDKKNRSFLSINLSTNTLVPNRADVPNAHFLPYSGSASALLPSGTGFDLNNIRHNLLHAENIQQVIGAGGTATYWDAFFRNDAGDSTFVFQIPVYLVYTNNIASGRFYLNPAKCPGINEASLFACPTFLPLPGAFYYANQHQIYTCTVSNTQGNSTASVGYSFSPGTVIKAMKVFKSGYSGPNSVPRTPFPSTESRVLVVATDETSSGNGHNVYFININANGSLATTYTDKYSGFNKIIDIRFKKDVNL